MLYEIFGHSAVKRREQRGVSGGATRPAAAYLRGEQGETDRVQSGQVTRGRARAAHAAHLDTKPHNTLLIVRAPARLDLTPSPIMSLDATRG